MFSTPRMILLFFAATAAFALGMAYIAQYGFHLAPCLLCHYQRVPFGTIIVLGLAGYALNRAPRAFTGLIALAFLADSIIAFYHTGVERKWWRSFIEGCSTPDLSGDINDLLERIKAAPVTACTDIAWQDPILGLSMANYNVLYCLVLATLAGWVVVRK